jgi:hypothetical protein
VHIAVTEELKKIARRATVKITPRDMSLSEASRTWRS